jgi:hypothetical protein
MRDIRLIAVASFLSICGFMSSALAQTDTCASSEFIQTFMPLGLMSPRVAFTGIVKTTFEQKLYDGNVIRQITHSREARDSAGRVRNESRGGCAPGDDGQLHSMVSVSVSDPVAHTSTSWQEGAGVLRKVVRVFHQPQLVQTSAHTATPEEREQQKQFMEKLRRANEAQNGHLKSTVSHEDLGTKQISGIAARGTRNTEMIPTGLQGNDLPLVVITETWTAIGVPGLILMRVMDDPRRGRTVSEFGELKLGEPDPALFTPPGDYKVQELTPGGVMGGISAFAGGVSLGVSAR